MNRILICAPLFLSLLASCALIQPQAPQLRGLWVDAFGPGFKTPAQIDQLVLDAKKLKVNVLFAQVGRRGDCYCNRAAMPRTDDPEVPAGFDPLADLLTKAHAAGLQVDAWIITTALWNSTTPPVSPAHAFNLHGPAAGQSSWLTQKADGTLKAGADWVLDPGNMDAAEYIQNMYTSVVKNYAVDGIQFDRVRYPDGSAYGGPLEWGYNAAALERYRAETGATGIPLPADPQWSAWRRQQVTNLVRQTALAVKAIRPSISVNAATITYSGAPTDEAGFVNSRPYAEVGQDWLTWVQRGYLDLNVMMNYKHNDQPKQAQWFDEWNTFAAALLKKYPHTAQVSGSATYLNDQNSSVSQARRSLRAGLSGWAMYSYRAPDREVNSGQRGAAQVWPELSAKLSDRTMPFESSAPWRRPDTAHFRALSGKISVLSGALGWRTVQLLDTRTGQELGRTITDGAGRYGFMALPVSAVTAKIGDVRRDFTLDVGKVTLVPDLALP